MTELIREVETGIERRQRQHRALARAVTCAVIGALCVTEAGLVALLVAMAVGL